MLSENVFFRCFQNNFDKNKNYQFTADAYFIIITHTYMIHAKNIKKTKNFLTEKSRLL